MPNIGNKISQVQNHYVQPTKAQHSIDVVKKYDGRAVGSCVLLLCCFCSIEFEIPHHCWWLWEILLLLTLRNANCRVEFNSRCSTYYISKSTLFKRKPEKKKIFSEMKINLIRSWHKYVIPNSRPFVIQLCNYSVFLKGFGNCLKITFYFPSMIFYHLHICFYSLCFFHLFSECHSAFFVLFSSYHIS